MSDKFRRLIIEYKNAILESLVVMQRSGIRMPASSYDWVYMEIPMVGELEGGGCYRKHGVGCDVNLPEKSVDFDFGENGEIDGFDAWRLAEFAGMNLRKYGFNTAEELDRYVDFLTSEGVLTRSLRGQWFVNGEESVYAIDVDGRKLGDNLPLKIKDPILALHAHQFQAADLMRKNYKKFWIS
ncbi:DUF6896 domain-containing protein [Burkholderia cepacia]|uniref:DUF6896 domain-containing protein n=1 Tax=Burkholderia cepacia TaxID=292 RepID=UPI0039A49899